MFAHLRLLFFTCTLTILVNNASAGPNGWVSTQLSSDFVSEGAAVGDFNHDGHPDITTGPYVYLGPEFQQRVEFFSPKVYPVTAYSDNFFSFVADVNTNGLLDIIIFGFPGREARLYLNPGSENFDSHWKMHIIAEQVSNESPTLVDLIPGGLPEIVCSRDSAYGYYQPGENPTELWTWHQVSEPGVTHKPFGHGLGVGDLDGDGRLDIIDKQLWWAQPQELGGKWTMHQWALQPQGGGGAQMHAYDVDGDGDQDLITSLNAHAYGLAWFERVSEERFERHDIMGTTSIENPYGVAVSQLHAVALVDVDGDGLKDIVTGKRWYAHGGKDPGASEVAALYWFKLTRNEHGAEFVPHLIHDDFGVGVNVTVADLNKDGLTDIVSASKRGLIYHLQSPNETGLAAERWIFERPAMSEYTDGSSPEQAAAQMLVHDGFSVDLIASEPELTQPIAMCFDPRGRIWVVEGHTYPRRAPDGQGKDRIIILEDKDSDGSFETKKTFAEGINLASGIEVGFGGVWVGAAPWLLFYPDEDQNDVPDAEPTKLLDGWAWQDTHETLNSFTWGPDGWLYGCHGVFTHSNVGKPGAADSERERINAGVWRYHPTRHEFEVFAHGSSNPWGVDFNEQGDWFITACVIPHLYHITQGGRYFRQAGSHFNPYTYADIVTIADHLHYGDGSFNSANSRGGVDRNLVREKAASTSDVGGGHAHCGLTIYQASEFPKEFRGQLFFHNLHGHRIVRDHVEKKGSGFIGRHRPDFALSQDHRQIGVCIMQGPDGALYTSDWHDPQTCHNVKPEIWDRTDGRLFRIRYGDVTPYQFNLWEQSDIELIELLKHDNAFFARQAQRILQERAASGQLNDSQVRQQIYNMYMETGQAQKVRLRALWTVWSCGLLTLPELTALLKDSDPYIRGWAVQFLAETEQALPSPAFAAIKELAKQEQNIVVQRYLAAMLQRLPHEQRWDVAAGLLSHHILELDQNIPLLIWYGLEPLVEADAARLLQLTRSSGWRQLTQFVVRRTSVTEPGREALTKLLLQEQATESQKLILQEMLNNVISQAGGTMPASWKQVSTKLLASQDQQVVSLTRSLAIQFGDQSAFPYYRTILADASQPKPTRQEALKLLAAAKDAELPLLLIKLLDDPGIRADAIRNLARYNLPDTAQELAKRYQQFTPAEQTEVLTTLSSRKNYADVLISALEKEQIDATSVPAYIVRQIVSLDDPKLVTRLEKVWGIISSSSEDKQELYERYRKLLTSNSIARANLMAGKKLYEANCGTCHQLFGKGGNIGPAITGANRANVNYWLENILEPNAVIGRNYQMTTFVTAEGRVINGLIKSENDSAVTIQTVNDVVVLAIDDIDIRKASEKSLMPEDQLKPMTDLQVLQLFGYLMASEAAVADAEAAARRTKVPSPEPGVIRIEGESLLGTATNTGGDVRNQRMTSFGPYWSGDDQLWWINGKPEDRLTLELKDLPSGAYQLTLFPTTAVDYGRIDVEIGDQTRQADLFTKQVLPGAPIEFTKISVSADQPLEISIVITGTHPESVPRYMVGIDRIELKPLTAQ